MLNPERSCSVIRLSDHAPEDRCVQCLRHEVGEACGGCSHVCDDCAEDHCCPKCDVCDRRMADWDEIQRGAHYDCAPECRPRDPYHAYLIRQGFPLCKMIGDQDDGDGGWLELANCNVCGTTLARKKEGEAA